MCWWGERTNKAENLKISDHYVPSRDILDVSQCGSFRLGANMDEIHEHQDDENRDEGKTSVEKPPSDTVTIPTPWGPIIGSGRSLLLLFVAIIGTYALLLYVALPRHQPEILVDPLIEVVLTAQPPPTPRPRLRLYDENNISINPSERVFRSAPNTKMHLVVASGPEDDAYRWGISPELEEGVCEGDAGKFLGDVTSSRVTFVAPCLSGKYRVFVCRMNEATDDCENHIVGILLVE